MWAWVWSWAWVWVIKEGSGRLVVRYHIAIAIAILCVLCWRGSVDPVVIVPEECLVNEMLKLFSMVKLYKSFPYQRLIDNIYTAIQVQVHITDLSAAVTITITITPKIL